jgi:hypothetical protein
MALLTADNSTDNINFGSGAALDNLAAATILLWVKLPSVANALRAWFSKDPAGALSIICFRRVGDGTSLRFTIDRGVGTAMTRDTLTATLVANEWMCLAFVWNIGSGRCEIHKGNLTTPMADRSTGGSSGSGAKEDDSAGDWKIGAYTGTNADAAQWATHAIFNRDLSAAEIEEWRAGTVIQSGLAAYHELGWNGTSTQPDLSGNGHAGTVTGATVADHVPAGVAFGFDEWVGYAPVPVPSIAAIQYDYRRRRVA